MNEAVIFVKPHANRPEVLTFIKTFLEQHGVKITAEVSKTASDLEKFIDHHYAVLSKPAMTLQSKDLLISEGGAKRFLKTFGENWDLAVEEGRVLNAKEFEERYKDQDAIMKSWEAEAAKKTVVAPGVIVGLLVGHPSAAGSHFDDSRSKNQKVQCTYVINAFYMNMRARYTHPKSSVTAMILAFDEKKLSWKDFRGVLIGKTNPEKAAKGSLRKEILEKWKALKLDARPDYGNNGVHASAGPIEALRERSIWFEVDLKKDAFVQSLLKKGMSMDKVTQLMDDIKVFDDTEDMNTSTVVDLLTSTN